MQMYVMYDNFEGLPLSPALFGLVSYSGPCKTRLKEHPRLWTLVFENLNWSVLAQAGIVIVEKIWRRSCWYKVQVDYYWNIHDIDLNVSFWDEAQLCFGSFDFWKIAKRDPLHVLPAETLIFFCSLFSLEFWDTYRIALPGTYVARFSHYLHPDRRTSEPSLGISGWSLLP